MIKKVAFLEGRLFSANQRFLNTFQIALIGWIKSGPAKSHFYFDHANRLKITDLSQIYQTPSTN